MKNITLIPALISSVKNDISASYYFDEAFKDVNSSITAFLIQLITKKKRINPNSESLKIWEIELDKYPITLKENFQFESRKEVDQFLKPFLKREKELFVLLK